MFIIGNEKHPIFEIEMGVFNILTRAHEIQIDFAHAENVQQAKALMNAVYGENIDFIRVESEA